MRYSNALLPSTDSSWKA